MNKTIIRFMRGRGSARFILPILLLWLFAHTETAFGQLPPRATTKEATDVTASSAQDFWTSVNTDLTNPDVRSLAVNSTSGDVFAGTFDGGVFRSTNNGNSWTGDTTGLRDRRVFALAINSSGHIFAGTFNGRIFRSTSNGTNWVEVTNLGNSKVLALTINATNGHIFAGTSTGVYRSTNNGGNWADINNGLTNEDVRTLAVNTSGDIFAGTGGGVFLSTNNGNRWADANTGLQNLSVLTLAISKSGTIFAGTAAGIFRSEDDGNTWMRVFLPTSGTNALETNALAINAAGIIFAGAFGGGVFRSSNNGDNWAAVNTGLTSLSLQALAITPSGFLFAGTAGGAFRSVETTGAAPTATTNAATNVGATSATLNGFVNANGLSTTVKFEYGTTTSYRDTMMATPSPVDGQSSVSAVISGLSSNRTYHYRAVATNSAGTTNGSDQIFTTSPPATAPTVTTNNASGIGSTSATLNGTVNPNNASTAVKFEYGTTTSYGSEITATQSPVTGNSDMAVSATLTGLASNTQYHYRVVATNSAGTTNGLDQTFTTLAVGSAPTVTTNAAAEVCSTSATLRGTVNPNGLNTTVIFQYGATASYGDTATATPNPVTGTTLVSVSAGITKLSPGTMYHFRVVATNNEGKRSTGDDQAFTAYSSTLSLNKTIDFPSRGRASDYQATDYRLVGLPGASNRVVNEFFAGQQNEDWEVVWDNGEASNFFVRFNGGADFKFSVGRAFWAIHKGPLVVNATVPSAPLDSCRFVSIPLRLGWNLISNPFTTSIQWPVIQSANGGLSQPVYSYNGGFNTPSSFDPYIGYYFFNEKADRSKLKIPYPSSSAASVALDVDPVLWRVNVTLTSGEFVDKITSFGVAKKASSELDPLDFRKPRSLAVTPTVSFHRPTWDAQYSAFATDIRPEIAEFENWDFEVRTMTREAVQLTFSGITKIPAPFEVYLIDEGRARTINLRQDSLYRFTPAVELSKFNVVAGKKDAVQEKLSAVALPKEFALGHNYPNPFLSGAKFPAFSGGNQVTTIPVAVPNASEIKLVVYNILGREVRTIYRGALPAGRYWFNWEGKDETGNPVATGVYFYRLTTSTSVALLGKMLVIR